MTEEMRKGVRRAVALLSPYLRHQRPCEYVTIGAGVTITAHEINGVPCEHVCGLHGYDPWRDPPCPACDSATRVERETKCTCGFEAAVDQLFEPINLGGRSEI